MIRPFHFNPELKRLWDFFKKPPPQRGISYFHLNVPRTLRLPWSWFHSEPDSGGLPVPPYFENVQLLHSQGKTSRNFVLGSPHLSTHMEEGHRLNQTCTQLARFTDPGFLREPTISQMEPSTVCKFPFKVCMQSCMTQCNPTSGFRGKESGLLHWRPTPGQTISSATEGELSKLSLVRQIQQHACVLSGSLNHHFSSTPYTSHITCLPMRLSRVK